jgi:protein phosphatase
MVRRDGSQSIPVRQIEPGIGQLYPAGECILDKIAILSDIHGNLTALEHVLAEIDDRGISRILCLGDLIGKGPLPAECVDLILSRCESTVKGNWDHLATQWKTRNFMRWHREKLGQERIDRLYGLPVYLEFMMSGRMVRLCHASPHDLFHRVFMHTEPHERMRLFSGTATSEREADVLGYGDIHGAYVEHFTGVNRGKVIFNAGSVGNPLEIPQASYAILEGSYGSMTPMPFSITLARVPYDIEEAVRLAMKSGMPHLDEYVDELRTGIYRTRDFS